MQLVVNVDGDPPRHRRRRERDGCLGVRLVIGRRWRQFSAVVEDFFSKCGGTAAPAPLEDPSAGSEHTFMKAAHGSASVDFCLGEGGRPGVVCLLWVGQARVCGLSAFYIWVGLSVVSAHAPRPVGLLTWAASLMIHSVYYFPESHWPCLPDVLSFLDVSCTQPSHFVDYAVVRCVWNLYAAVCFRLS